MNPVGLNVRCSCYDLAYTHAHNSRLHKAGSFYRQKKIKLLANAANIQLILLRLSCKIKVRFLEYITPTQLHTRLWEKLSNVGLFVDISWADKCQWYTVSDKDIHSCSEFFQMCSSASFTGQEKRKESVAVRPPLPHLRCHGDKWKAESPTQLIKWVSDNKSIFSHCVDKQYICTVTACAARLEGLGNARLGALWG